MPESEIEQLLAIIAPLQQSGALVDELRNPDSPAAQAVSEIQRMLNEKIDEALTFMAAKMGDMQRMRFVEELQDPTSLACFAVNEISRLARGQIDISRIPGLQEVARWEHDLQNKK